MKEYSSDKIRNVLLAGHGGTGKTSLGEALLYASGATSRLGSVDDGSSLFDFEEEEHTRKLSVSLAVAPVEWREHKINILDAPGYADFVGEVQAGLAVCDVVCLVVSAVEGVEVQHEVVWHLADQLDLPRLVFVNKVDRERADVMGTIDALTKAFGTSVAPLHIPIGAEEDFRGVVDLLADAAFVYADGKATQEAVPEDLAADGAARRGALVEAVVENDEDLMERYFADEPIDAKELRAMLGQAMRAGETYPVVVGSARKMIGVDLLADLLVEAAPSPLDSPAMRVATPEGPGDPLEDAPEHAPAVFVYKTYADPFVGQVSYFRVAAGEVLPDVHLLNQRSGTDERLHQLFALRGKEHETIPKLCYGDLGAVSKLSATATGDTLADKSAPVTIAGIEPAEPLLAVALSPKTKGDEDKLATALHRIEAEDPTVRVERNPATSQTLLWGVGETHLNITLERMHRKFGVEVDTVPPKVAYRETARKGAEFEGKHKKQSGGRGQFGVASVRLEPLPRGSGYEFVDAIVGGVIPRQFIPAVDKGIQEAMHKGPLAGYPVVDVRLTVFDGKAHSVDSDEHSFKMAGALGLRGSLQAGDPVLLEPIGLYSILVPDTLAGDVSGDLNSRRGRLQGMESVGGGRSLIKALVPMAEMSRYAIDLRSITGGRGTFTVDFDHYDEVPPQIAEKVVAESKSAD
ncbi:MAG: elongation factor G [Acidimicrobiia bacterium]|nr:elongation factor G [Acidimicrobiia bacterium]